MVGIIIVLSTVFISNVNATGILLGALPNGTSTIYGDINGNGKINIGDALVLNQYINGERALYVSQVESCDVNADGLVDATDLNLLKQWVSSSTKPEGTRIDQPIQ